LAAWRACSWECTSEKHTKKNSQEVRCGPLPVSSRLNVEPCWEEEEQEEEEEENKEEGRRRRKRVRQLMPLLSDLQLHTPKTHTCVCFRAGLRGD